MYMPFYTSDEWKSLLANGGFRNLSDADKKRFVECSIEDGYRREYYSSIEYVGLKNPTPWESLTEEQREDIRETVRQQRQAMHEFGQAIANGNLEQIDQAGKKLVS